MKKSSLIMACILIALVLCWAVAVSALAEWSQPDREPGAFAGKVIILPFANGDYYSVADPEKRILETLASMFQLLPADGSVTYEILLYGEKPTPVSGPQEAFSKISLAGPGKGKNNINPSNQIKSLSDITSNDTLLLVIDCSDDYKTSWNGLKDIANNGTKIVFIEIESTHNKNKYSKFVDNLSGVPLIPNKIVTTTTKGLDFCWINDTEKPLNVLLPLFEELTGSHYTAVQPDANGEYNIDLFTSLTEQVRLAIQRSSELNVSEDKTALILADGVEVKTVIDNSIVLATTGEGSGKITVSPAAGAVYYEKQEKSTKDISLSISVGHDQNFNVKEENSYYITITGAGIDEVAFAADMESRGIQMILRNEEGSFAQPMDWNVNKRCWETTVTYDNSGEWILYAEVDLGVDKSVITSETHKITVLNKKPTVALGSGVSDGTENTPIMLWINNPWDENTQSSVTIPLLVTDDEGSEVTLSVEKEDGSFEDSTFVTGLGTVAFSKNKDQIEITLDKQGEKLAVKTDEAFLITVKGSDGDKESDPLSVWVILQDLTAEIQQVTAGTIETDETLIKKHPFEVAFVLNVSDCKNPDDVLMMLLDKAQYYVGLEDQEVVPMKYDDDRKAFCASVKQDSAGQTEITITEALGLPVPGSKTIVVAGNRPVRHLNAENPENIEDRIDKNGNNLWDSNPLIGTTLFIDEDEDEIKLLVNVVRMDKTERTIKLTEVLDDAYEMLGESNEAHREDKPAIYIATPAEVGETKALEIPATKTFQLRFLEEGSYTVTLRAKDIDGESDDSFVFNISLVSLKTIIISCVKKYAPVVIASLILFLILAWVLKPSYKNRVLQLINVTENAKQTVELPLKSWKKAKKPLWQVLTCAAFPPEPALYKLVSKTEIKPTCKGVQLLNAGVLTRREKRVKIDEDHPFHCQLDGMMLTITLKKAEKG